MIALTSVHFSDGGYWLINVSGRTLIESWYSGGYSYSSHFYHTRTRNVSLQYIDSSNFSVFCSIIVINQLISGAIQLYIKCGLFHSLMTEEIKRIDIKYVYFFSHIKLVRDHQNKLHSHRYIPSESVYMKHSTTLWVPHNIYEQQHSTLRILYIYIWKFLE